MTDKKNSKNPKHQYEVEQIIAEEQRSGGETFFLIKWKGYSDLDNTWEPHANIKHLGRVVDCESGSLFFRFYFFFFR